MGSGMEEEEGGWVSAYMRGLYYIILYSVNIIILNDCTEKEEWKEQVGKRGTENGIIGIQKRVRVFGPPGLLA